VSPSSSSSSSSTSHISSRNSSSKNILDPTTPTTTANTTLNRHQKKQKEPKSFRKYNPTANHKHLTASLNSIQTKNNYYTKTKVNTDNNLPFTNYKQQMPSEFINQFTQASQVANSKLNLIYSRNQNNIVDSDQVNKNIISFIQF